MKLKTVGALVVTGFAILSVLTFVSPAAAVETAVGYRTTYDDCQATTVVREYDWGIQTSTVADNHSHKGLMNVQGCEAIGVRVHYICGRNEICSYSYWDSRGSLNIQRDFLKSNAQVYKVSTYIKVDGAWKVRVSYA